MSMNTDLQGRLRNTTLPQRHGLLPLFEAVVNSIHAIDELRKDVNSGEIIVEVIRSPQSSIHFESSKSKRGACQLESIIGFKIYDNGIGFHNENIKSFKTLDSTYKATQGCRGVGRLLWLKAFDYVNIISIFANEHNDLSERKFSFSSKNGVENLETSLIEGTQERKTIIHLDGFKKDYQEKSAKTVKSIANQLFEHCLWYFVRDGGVAKISVKDESDVVHLNDIQNESLFLSIKKDSFDIKNQKFELTHIKLKASSEKSPFIAWCAASRVVQHESIAGKITGLHGKIKTEVDEFIYACYIKSDFLDKHVRPERTGFDIEEQCDDLFSDSVLCFNEIRNHVLLLSKKYLENYLDESKKAGKKRVEDFVSTRAPRYRPILARISDEKLSIDPRISDKELELILHKQLSEIEGSLLSEGHDIMNFGGDESRDDYQNRLHHYLSKVEDIKKSDLASYVSHRKVILDIFEKSIKQKEDGKYAKEELIHQLIMPLRKTSNDILLDGSNLWLIDERLAFHNYLASDKTLASMPIIDSSETKEPDIVALNVFDQPILVADGKNPPFASLVVIELKRPMRNDASTGEENDPIEQAIGYLERIRKGETRTASGRPIPRSEDIPGFCYIICDITPRMEQRCKMHELTPTSDNLGYFGYKKNYKAYIEVISFDRLLNSARERNRAFFDRLGLPTN